RRGTAAPRGATMRLRSSRSPTRSSSTRSAWRSSLSNLQLFIACVAIWGSTWLAIKFQLGRVAPEASVFYRFLLASALAFAYCLGRRLPLAYRAREHAWIALFGVFMFGVSYIFVYY